MRWRVWMVAGIVLCLSCGGAPRGTVAVEKHVDDGDDCAGILPGNLPESRMVVLQDSRPHTCGYVTVDGLGNVAAEVHAPDGAWRQIWHVFDRDGPEIGSFSNIDSGVMPQPSGFQALRLVPTDPYPPSGGRWLLFHLNADGTVRSTTPAGGNEECGASLYRIWAGGSQAVVDCTFFTDYVSFAIFDSSGQRIGGGHLGNRSWRGAAGPADLNGLTLFLFPGASGGYGPDDIAGRWYDQQATPVTDYFLLATVPQPRSGWFGIHPLIGGGVAFQANGQWLAFSPSGVPESQPAPDWLAPYVNYDIEIVRGGRAHALIPKYPLQDRSTIPLFSASGNHCGDVTFPMDNVTVGIDGTAISSTGDDACTINWWPQVLP